MALTGESVAAFALGTAVYVLFFNRGEHHLHPQRYLIAFGTAVSATVALLHFHHHLPLLDVLRTTTYLSLSFLAGLYSSLLFYRQFLHPLNKFPGPFGTRISALFLSVKFSKADSSRQYLRLHKKYGDFVRTGSSDLSIIHPKGVQAVYGPGTACTKGDAYDATHPFKSLHSFRDRQLHDNRRRVWSAAFGDTALRGYEKRIRKYRDMLMSTFAASEGKPVNVVQWFNNYSFDIVGDLAFGQSFDMLKKDELHWSVRLLAEAFEPLAYALPTWMFRLAQVIPGATKDWFRFLDFCRERIITRMKNTPDIPDITSTLLAPLEGKNVSQEDLNLLVGDSQLMMAAGGDTTATTLSSIIFELCLHPDQLDQLRKEVAPYMTDPSGDVLNEKITHIDHLNGVIYEALRLHPPVPGIIQRKTPPEGIWIDEVHVPGNVFVFCPQYAIGRSEAVYEQPEEFIPERWYSRPELVKEKSAFAPFLVGTYGCIGRPLAMMNLRSTLARLITTFDFKFAEGEDGSTFDGKSTNHFLWVPGDLFISFTKRVPNKTPSQIQAPGSDKIRAPSVQLALLNSSNIPKRITMASKIPWRAFSARATTRRSATTLPEQYRCFSCSIRANQQIRKSETDSRMTHFGFENIPEAEKESRVGAVFSSVASSYDTMNDLMSLGIHRLWKDHFVRSLNPGSPKVASSSSPSENDGQKGWNILDIAGGSGDIAFRMLDHATNINNDRDTRVTVADINADMLAEGRKRSLDTPYYNTNRLSFMVANAEHMPTVPDNSVDLYTVSFGIRNFTDKQAALNEAYRVLKPGGVFACMEFSKVQDFALFNEVYKRWSFSAIPLIGQLVAGDRASYQYLVESIEQFPSQEEFRSMIAKAGFVIPGRGYENLSFGIAAIHKGVKPLSSK